jgi:hypothetical protein
LGILQPNFSLPFFDNVTHLRILDSVSNWSAWTGIHLLPRLSHIRLHMDNVYGTQRPAQVVSDLLIHCKTLQVCMIGLQVESTRRRRSFLETFQLQVPKDDRLVFVVQRTNDLNWDWECFLHGISHTDTWAYAESVVMRQQQTGCRVDTRYVYDGDEANGFQSYY